MRKPVLLFLLFLITFFFASACGFRINKTIYIEDGDTRSGSLNSVNGSIIIGEQCVVRGSSRSVNGRIEVGRESEVEDLQTVNGKIRIAGDVKIDGDIESVNGSIRCGAGVNVDGRITAINGRIELERTTVERDIHTTNGDITLADNTKVKGDIVIEGRKGRGRDTHRLDIRISGDSVVEGKIIVKDRRRDVRVYLSNGGRVLGEIENAKVVNE
ncbi:hypothetical protein IID10_21285 [candidate division KSB1 bacterium]|nr:hypothetical protein [candidate division KSB1 bacterium]